MHKPEAGATRLASVGVYLTLLAFAFLEQFQRVTSDTRIAIIESPLAALKSTFTLWNPLVSLGELQNQAYGYLFPMGPFFLVGELLHAPPWMTERLWSVALLIVGCEGARLVARSFGLGLWPAWLAGMSYGLNARVIGQVATRSAEVLPGVVLPWVLLPIVLALSGRLSQRTAALFSIAAYLFMGAVNATATVATLPLVVILIVWGIRTRRATWALAGWWVGLFVLASLWWITALLKLSAYSPPFFDFVEDAKVTTLTTGFFPSLRAADNWVGYLAVGDRAGWPAGYFIANNPVMIVFTTAVAVIGLVGLVRWSAPWRQPLLVAAFLGLVLLTIGHTSPAQSPLAPLVQSLLDGPLALLRNVHKIDPVLRLPLAIGVGAAVTQWQWFWHRRTPEHSAGRGPQRRSAMGVGLVSVLALGIATPAVAMNLRTPGWTEFPDHWNQVADYLDEQPGQNTSWLLPGVGFGVQTWGWTMDEPLSVVARSPWVTRSQVPLTPPETIRTLSRLEDLVDTGTGSPYLGEMLGRLGLGFVVVRHDLDPSLSESTSSDLVSLALARSRGVVRVAEFGRTEFGPAVEVFKVTAPVADPVAVHDEADAVTVSSGTADVVDAVGLGLLGPEEPAVVQGDSGWSLPAEIVGDSYRLRERNFGRVHDSEGPVRSPDDPRQGDRAVPNYPGSPGAQPVFARYQGIETATASSSQGSVLSLGAVRPETAPFSAVDGDPTTSWQTASFHVPRNEWVQVELDAPTSLGRVTVTQPVEDPTVIRVLRWRLEAGGKSLEMDADPFAGTASFNLFGVEAATVRLTALKVARPGVQGPIGVSELDLGETIGRTMVLPEEEVSDTATYSFTARPETRACIPTLLGPDCQITRRRLSDESTGIDRTFTVARTGDWKLAGRVVARSGLATTTLLDPFSNEAVVRSSSTFAGDPQVSARMLYDGSPATAWIADPRDVTPEIVVDFSRPRTISRMSVAAPPNPAVAPTRATVRSGGEVRNVVLDEFGVMDPIRGRRFVISLRNPTSGGAPIGVGDLRLEPTSITSEFDGSTRTGAVCGFGPVVRANGVRYDTRVEGLMGDVAAAGQLAIESCDGPIALRSGENRVRIASTPQFQPIAISLRAKSQPGDPEPADLQVPRTLAQDTSTAVEQRFTLGEGDESLLSTTRNFNLGWQATLNGKILPTQRVDGWAQGWQVPAGDGGSLVIRFQPQTSYVVGLIGGLAIAGLILLGAVVALFRVRLKPEGTLTPGADRPGRHGEHVAGARSRARRFVVGEALLVLIWLIGGLPLAAGFVVAWLAQRLHLALHVLAVVSMFAAAVIVIVQGWDGPILESDQANAVAGVGFGILFGLAWRSPFAARGPAHG